VGPTSKYIISLPSRYGHHSKLSGVLTSKKTKIKRQLILTPIQNPIVTKKSPAGKRPPTATNKPI